MRDVMAFGFGIVVTIVGYATYTDHCLTTPGHVWDVDYETCAPRNAYVPAGYVPAPTPRVPNAGR